MATMNRISRPWHLSILQHCLIPRWYSSIFPPEFLNDFLSDSDASRMSGARRSDSCQNEQSWMPLRTILWQMHNLSLRQYRFQKHCDYSSDPGLPTDRIWVGYTMPLQRTDQFQVFNTRIPGIEKMTIPGLDFRESTVRIISLNWSFLVLLSLSGLLIGNPWDLSLNHPSGWLISDWYPE